MFRFSPELPETYLINVNEPYSPQALKVAGLFKPCLRSTMVYHGHLLNVQIHHPSNHIKPHHLTMHLIPKQTTRPPNAVRSHSSLTAQQEAIGLGVFRVPPQTTTHCGNEKM